MAQASVPLWVAVTIAVGSPLLAFLGLLLGQLLTRRSARETETRWQREETMRLLRWAADLSTGAAVKRARLGIVALRALAAAPLLQSTDLNLVGAVLGEAVRGTGHSLD